MERSGWPGDLAEIIGRLDDGEPLRLGWSSGVRRWTLLAREYRDGGAEAQSDVPVVDSPICETCGHYEGEHHARRVWEARYGEDRRLHCYHSNGGVIADCACAEYVARDGGADVSDIERQATLARDFASAFVRIRGARIPRRVSLVRGADSRGNRRPRP